LFHQDTESGLEDANNNAAKKRCFLLLVLLFSLRSNVHVLLSYFPVCFFFFGSKVLTNVADPPSATPSVRIKKSPLKKGK
jgi:hypothetical protein